MKKFVLIFIVNLIFLLQSFGAVVAVIDSGTDLDHELLKNNKWINAKELLNNKDDDYNGKVDDIYGWNFAENNNQLIDLSYLGKFSSDVYKFFEVQLRIIKGEATQDDLNWYKSKKGDQDFLHELSVFGNFVHGTHVAGIIAKNTKNKIMPIKLLPTEVKLPKGKNLDFSNSLFLQNFEIAKKHYGIKSLSPSDDKKIEKLIYFALNLLASQNAKSLENIGLYLWFHKPKVANCSFGTSTQAFSQVLEQILKQVLKREPTKEELLKYSKYFVTKVIEQGQQFAVDAKDTLFVIAAGNDGMNNDIYPTYPANIKRFNTITVAATEGYKRLASFSNYGMLVDVAAPGVGILSSIPGNMYLTVSGTSQAAPFVSHVLGEMMDINPKLNFNELKKILMDTSDKKDFLKDKVLSGGIVNPERAKYATKLTLTHSIDASIMKARNEVHDVIVLQEFEDDFREDFVIDMPQIFKF
jgi:subtilisin family serine protease